MNHTQPDRESFHSVMACENTGKTLPSHRSRETKKRVLGGLVLLGSLGIALPGARAQALDPTDAYELLRASQESYRDIAQRLKPSLVRIDTVGGSQPRGFLRVESDEERPGETPRLQNQFREEVGSDFTIADGPTTGIVYSDDGYIITSSFNFVRKPVLISVTLADGQRLVAELVARDQVRKIALLKVDADGLEVPQWADPNDVRIGQSAVALGLGFGGDHPSIAVGIVSARNRMHGNAIQVDAKLSPANYGGPACDLQGNIIGIAVPMGKRPGELAGIELYDSGVGFVVTKDRVDEIVDVLKTGRSFYRGWLGIQVNLRSRDAVVIGNIADPSPMRVAGVLPGDKILGAEGQEIRHFGHLVQAIYMIPAGEQVYLHLERNDREFGKVVTLARNTELGPLPDLPEPFDPSTPTPREPEEE